MPFIDVKISISLREEQKSKIVSELGKDISLLNKPESYLMIELLINIIYG